MEVIIQFALLAVGFLLLIKGADWFVGGASKIADRFGIPQLIRVDYSSYGNERPGSCCEYIGGC